jgi:hypothetical protein
MLAERAMAELSRYFPIFLPVLPDFAGNALWNQFGCVNDCRGF